MRRPIFFTVLTILLVTSTAWGLSKVPPKVAPDSNSETSSPDFIGCLSTPAPESLQIGPAANPFGFSVTPTGIGPAVNPFGLRFQPARIGPAANPFGLAPKP